jgi:hypothetical protein
MSAQFQTETYNFPGRSKKRALDTEKFNKYATYRPVQNIGKNGRASGLWRRNTAGPLSFALYLYDGSRRRRV